MWDLLSLITRLETHYYADKKIRVHIKHVHCSKHWIKEVQIIANIKTTEMKTTLALRKCLKGKVKTRAKWVLWSFWSIGRSVHPRKDFHWEHLECLLLECDSMNRKHAVDDWRLPKGERDSKVVSSNPQTGWAHVGKWRSTTLPTLHS